MAVNSGVYRSINTAMITKFSWFWDGLYYTNISWNKKKLLNLQPAEGSHVGSIHDQHQPALRLAYPTRLLSALTSLLTFEQKPWSLIKHILSLNIPVLYMYSSFIHWYVIHCTYVGSIGILPQSTIYVPLSPFGHSRCATKRFQKIYVSLLTGTYPFCWPTIHQKIGHFLVLLTAEVRI